MLSLMLIVLGVVRGETFNSCYRIQSAEVAEQLPAEICIHELKVETEDRVQVKTSLFTGDFKLEPVFITSQRDEMFFEKMISREGPQTACEHYKNISLIVQISVSRTSNNKTAKVGQPVVFGLIESSPDSCYTEPQFEIIKYSKN